jgi:WD repeat and SOF domain-containing protein 1
MSSKELGKMEYRDSLREKWKNVGDVARVERQRHVPKPIFNAARLRREMDTAAKKKDENRRKHAPKSRPMDKPAPERKRGIRKIE